MTRFPPSAYATCDDCGARCVAVIITVSTTQVRSGKLVKEHRACGACNAAYEREARD